jgi:hypothetical protein
MKKTIWLLLIFTASLSAQRYKIISGKLDNLKGITEYHVTLDKAGMVVHGFDSEIAFVNAKVEKRKQHKDTLQAINFERIGTRRMMPNGNRVSSAHLTAGLKKVKSRSLKIPQSGTQ